MRPNPGQPSPSRHRHLEHLDLAVLLAASAITALLYLHLHAHLGPATAPTLANFQPGARVPPAGFGWWAWWDQSLYMEAALAWAHGVLDPAYHWFLPLYPLLAAPFVRLTPADPFVLPNLACLLAALWLFAALAARLLPMRHARTIGAAVFLATSVLPQSSLWTWVVPWSTTPQTVCTLACLLAAARFVERLRPLDAFLAALAGVAIAALRPTDALAVLTAAAATMAWTLLERRPPWPRFVQIALAALAGAAIPILLFGAAYAVVWGAATSEYIASNANAFEWRLIPQRWVELVIDPKPLFPAGNGIAAVYKWIAPGLAGMLACLLVPLPSPSPRPHPEPHPNPRAASRRMHVPVIAATLLDLGSYLAYRDLHPKGLWQYGNYHYFKWMLPIFGIYALLLLHRLATRPTRVPALAATLATIPALFMWRIELTGLEPMPLLTASSTADAPGPTSTVALSSAMPQIGHVLLARAHGGQDATYMSPSRLQIGSQTFRNTADFKLFLWSDTLMLEPLRPFPPAPAITPATITLITPGVAIDTDIPPLLAEQHLAWGLPCWFRPSRAACQTTYLFPPAPLPLDQPVELGSTGHAEDYLLTGWSVPDPHARWTEGPHASLRFTLPAIQPGQRVSLELTAHGFTTPHDNAPTRTTVLVNVSRSPAGAWGPPRPRSSTPRSRPKPPDPAAPS